MRDIYKFKDKIDASVSGISKKTINKIINAWYDSGNAPTKIKSDIPESDKILLIEQIKLCMQDTGGDISRQAKVIHLAMIYLNSLQQGKKVFLETLACEFDIDIKILADKIENLKNLTEDNAERVKAEIDLSKALIPPRVLFLRQLSALPNGFIFLKDMREVLLRHQKEIPRLKKLDNDIKAILKSYFDVNLLQLKEITWSSPASVLESLIKYEAVHEIKSWKHLKHRLLSNHKMFGFFHPSMPEDPIIFVEVALVKGLADNVQELIELDIEEDNNHRANTAIFYSISSTQKGLRGISFGNLLIKRVVKEISEELPHIKNFATLSPVPLFAKWLPNYLENGGDNFCKKSDINAINKIKENSDTNKTILEILSDKDWYKNSEIDKVLKMPLLKICLHYLSVEKRKGKINAYDPVANFHLSNGAEIGQLNWLGDVSENGMNQSFGIMINYRYRLNKIVDNHENYLSSGEVSISKNVIKGQLFSNFGF